MTASQKTTTSLLALTLLALCACRPSAPEPRGEITPPTVTTSEPTPTPPLTANPDANEIFRRAFWRHPTAQDRILHAERRETHSDNTGVERWQWFLALHPSPDLLAALGDPEVLGLVRVTAPRPWPDEPPPPAWFPAADTRSGFDILQAPDAGLTILYRESDNTLYATDTGKGFAAPVSRP